MKHDEFFAAHEKEQGRSYLRDLFPQRRHAGDEFDDTEKPPEETAADIAKKRKKYDFSKIDAYMTEQKSMLSFDALKQFMSHELHEGDRIEAVKEIVYPNEGLVIPVGRRGLVRKVALDHREEFAAVEWDYTKGLRAVDTRAKYYMKQPMEVVFGCADAPSTIQWPTFECMSEFADVNCTWQYRPKGEVQSAGIQHPESESLRLRQGYKANCFALESSICPKMMLALVPTGKSGAGGVKDPRRLRLVDYTEKKELVDKFCCFKPKRVGEKILRLESTAERNIFLMLKLPADPRVCAPFVHVHTYSMNEIFMKNSQFCICLTQKVIPKYAKSEFDVVHMNPAFVMQEQQALQGFKNERVTFVEAHSVGESALGVRWVPNVGKCRLWMQFRNGKDTSLNSQWVLASAEAGGSALPCSTILDTRICNGYEQNFDQVRVTVAPLARMHRFKDILQNNFYKANASASDWTNLPDSAVWTRPIENKRKNYWESSDEEDEEEAANAPAIADRSGSMENLPPLQDLLQPSVMSTTQMSQVDSLGQPNSLEFASSPLGPLPSGNSGAAVMADIPITVTNQAGTTTTTGGNG
ncbi:unnamed protein product [Amoebophrya sp. A120]|nr:unnamed protein product [Amoebophrya sp. A120]|eukprot:GSA120T00003862001.1